jgi:NAD(P)H-dependent FMN reductase
MRAIEIVGLVGSPRVGMNTDTLVSRALAGAGDSGAHVRKVYLNDLQIKPCQACAAAPATGFCIYHDGMDVIYGLLESVDGLIVGSPAYYGSISSQLKLVVDRANCLQEMTKHPDGRYSFKTKVIRRKKGLFFWISDSSRDAGPAVSQVRAAFGDMNIELLESYVVVDADRGNGARADPGVLQRSFELGQMLVQRIAAEPK